MGRMNAVGKGCLLVRAMGLSTHPMSFHQNKDKEAGRLLQHCGTEAGVVVCLGMITHSDTVFAECW